MIKSITFWYYIQKIEKAFKIFITTITTLTKLSPKYSSQCLEQIIEKHYRKPFKTGRLYHIHIMIFSLYKLIYNVTILWWKIESISPKVRNKTKVLTLTTTVQHSFGSFGHSNQSRKINKRNPNWKRRSKTLTVWRWHDPLHRNP